MGVVLQQIINALVLRSMDALVALGCTMVYGIISLINFAHGEVLMVGALTSWTMIGLMRDAMPGAAGWFVLLLVTLIACVVAAALNLAIERIAYRPLRDSLRLSPLITAIDALKGKSVAVIDDSTTQGQGLADECEKALKARSPDLVSHNGMDAVARPMLGQMKSLGIVVNADTGLPRVLNPSIRPIR